MANFQAAPPNRGFAASTTRGFSALGFHNPILMWRLNPANGEIVDVVRYVRACSSLSERNNVTWGNIVTGFDIPPFPICLNGNVYHNTSMNRRIRVDSGNDVDWDAENNVPIQVIKDGYIFGSNQQYLYKTNSGDGTSTSIQLLDDYFSLEDLGFSSSDEMLDVSDGIFEELARSIMGVFTDSIDNAIWCIGPYYYVETDTEYCIVFAHKYDLDTSQFVDHEYFSSSTSFLDCIYKMPLYPLGIYDGYLYTNGRFKDGFGSPFPESGHYKMPFPSVSTKCDPNSEKIHWKHGVITPLPDYDGTIEPDIESSENNEAQPSFTSVIGGIRIFDFDYSGLILQLVARDFEANEVFRIDVDFATTVNSLVYDGQYICILGRE